MTIPTPLTKAGRSALLGTAFALLSTVVALAQSTDAPAAAPAELISFRETRMTAYNAVRFRVKPGMEDKFIQLQREALRDEMAGALDAALIKTGDRTYCFIGKWKSFDDLVAARPKMIASLDQIRSLLEDLGGGLGVTDPVSGPAVLELGK